MSIYDKNNKLLKNNQKVGTRARIIFKNKKNNTKVAEYNVVLYGDVNRKWSN